MNSKDVNKKETLIRISQYIFRKETKKVREDLQDSIVENALYLSGNRGLTIDEIGSVIHQELELSFPSLLITKSLNRLLNVKKTVQIKGSRYFLKKERIAEIRQIVKERRDALDRIETLLVEKLKRHYKPSITEDQLETARSALYEFLASLFMSQSKFIVGILRPSKNVSHIIHAPLEILDSVLKNIKDEAFRTALHKSVLELFQNITKEIGECLYTLAQNFLYVELLNIDPEFRFLEREAFSRKTIFLDTNAIMSLLLPSRETHKAMLQIISLSKSLGAKFVYTKRTKKEWLDVLDKAKERYTILKCLKPDLLKNIDDDFIASYLIEKTNTPSLTWEGFYLTMRQIDIKLREFEIYEYDESELGKEVLSEKDLFQAIVDRTQYCAYLKGNIKSMDVAEHDAFHLLLVRKLRETKPADMLGPQYWFFTCDTSLPCVDVAINKETRKYSDSPSSMLAEIWLELITPFLGPKATYKELPNAFASLMKTHFATLPAKIQPDQLIEIAGPWLNYESLTISDIEQILADKVVQDYISKVRELRKKEPSKADELKKALQEVVEAKVSEILDRKLQSAKKEEKKLRCSLLTERKFWRVVSGILGTLLIASGICSSYIGNLTSACLFFVFGTILILLALAYRFLRFKIGQIELEAEE